jgi:hypothetical protein
VKRPRMSVSRVYQTAVHTPLYQPVPSKGGTPPDLRKHHSGPAVPRHPAGTAIQTRKTAGQRLYHPVPPTGEGGLTTPAALPTPIGGGPR